MGVSHSNVCFAFNPNGIVIDGYSGKTAEVTVGGRTVKVSIYSDSQRVEFGGLLTVLFGDMSASKARSVSTTLSVSVKDSEDNVVYEYSKTILVVWGAPDYVEDGGSIYKGSTRTVRWFTQFPFTVSVITSTGVQDIAPTGTTMSVSGLGFVKGNAIGLPESSSQTIILKKDDSSEGIYLRWVDRYGLMEYFLFSPGEFSTSSKGGDETIRNESVGGVEIERSLPRYRDSERTVRCEAAFLSDEELAYVSTIADSVLVEMYHSDGVWEPVSVEADISRNSRKGMHRVSVKIKRKTVNGQRL